MISFRDFSFCYEEMEEDALKNICLDIKDGEFVLLTGRSGCGKSTILRSLNGLIPHFYPGKVNGELFYDDRSLIEMEPTEIAGKIGTVFQDPRSQFFMTDTTRELAFGCENMGYKTEEIIDCVEKAVKELKLSDYLGRSIFSLSSGEKQQIAIGSIYAMNPNVYIFDEPSANLDYEATKRLARIMKKLKDSGCTIIVADHRFYYLRDLIDTAIYIENGKITGEYTREQFCNLDKMSQIQKGLRPVYPEKEICISENALDDLAQKADSIFKVENLSFGYDKNVNILENVSFEASSGDVIGIIGHNGAGKTTLISVLIGILKEKNGRVLYNGKKINPVKRRKLSYLVMQDADYQLFTASVEDELTLGISKPEKTKVDDILDRLNLLKYRNRHPASLSGGQKQRVTIGTSLMKECKILYFDEPTSGLDFDSMNRVSRMIKDIAEEGAIIFLVSHDFEFITNTCNKLFDFDIKSGNQMIEVNKENTERFANKYFNTI